MHNIRSTTIRTFAITLSLALTACSGMSAQDQSTAIGAGVGAIGGSVLTGGSTAGTVGGVIGHEIKK